MERVDSTGAFTIWRWSVACFVLAALTGGLFRFGLVWELPFELQFAYVRHAHSHLMYFGWTTPAIMALIASKLVRARGGAGRPLQAAGGYGSAVAALLLGLATYPAFLLAGYETVSMLGRELPAAAILSGLNLFAWYGFAAWYVRARRGLPATPALRHWDAAVFFLCLSSLGAWGRSALQMAGVDSPVLAATAVHFFLSVFAEGWLLFAVLGLMMEGDEGAEGRGLSLLSRLASAGGGGYKLLWLAVPLAALQGSSLVRTSSAWGALAGVSGVLLAVLLGDFVVRAWGARRDGRDRGWAFPLGFLAVKALMQLGLAFPRVAAWGEQVGLRIVYLHVLALGLASVGLMVAARKEWGEKAAPSASLFGGAVLLLLVGLLATTPLWPGGWGWYGRLLFAAVTSLLPVAAIGIASVRASRSPASVPDAR